jgi:TetR/AcrR family transcriptional regulator, mexJK operon transcriptional repressor
VAATVQRRAAGDPNEGDAPVHSEQTESGGSTRVEQQASEPPRRARRMASGAVIREAAAALFLEKGYQATSMDDIAAAAHISKQTIYTHFTDKEALFADLVLSNADRVDEFMPNLVHAVRDAADVRSALHQLARSYIHIVGQPEVIRLRRLVIGESGRFPEVARAYYEKVLQRMYSALADLLSELGERGDLRLDDPVLAAHQFAWLILGVPLDRGMFLGADDPMPEAELDRIADGGVAAFLAAYGG